MVFISRKRVLLTKIAPPEEEKMTFFTLCLTLASSSLSVPLMFVSRSLNGFFTEEETDTCAARCIRISGFSFSNISSTDGSVMFFS